MRTLLIAALLTFGTSFATHAKDYKDVTIATEGAYAPWNFKNAAGELVGFEVDLAKDLCARMNVKCKIVEQAWDGIIPSLRAGKFDAIMAGMSITEKRKKTISFSRAYAATPARFVVLKSSKSAGLKTAIDTVSLPQDSDQERDAVTKVVSEFKGQTIGVQIATTHERFLRQAFGDKASVRTYDTQENLDLDLKAGRVDAALAAMSYWKPLLESEKGKDMVAVGPGFQGGPFGAGVGVGIRKEDGKLGEMFTKAIDASIADGVVSKLATKWFGFDASVK